MVLVLVVFAAVALVGGRPVAGLALLVAVGLLIGAGLRRGGLGSRRGAGSMGPAGSAGPAASPRLMLDEGGVTVLGAGVDGVGADRLELDTGGGTAALAWSDVAAVVASPAPPGNGIPAGGVVYLRFLPAREHAVVLDPAGRGAAHSARGSVFWLVPSSASREIDAALREIARRRPALRIVDSRQ